MAYSEYEATLCPCGCGYPIGKAWDDTMDGWFEPRTVVCYAKAARDQWEKEHAERDEKGNLYHPPKEGELLMVVDASVDED
nr:MAG TPA: Cytochrome C biogenesis protein [Caudoviricetes sp.]